MAENMGNKSVYIWAFWPREINKSSQRSIQSNIFRRNSLRRLEYATFITCPTERIRNLRSHLHVFLLLDRTLFTHRVVPLAEAIFGGRGSI